MRIQSNRAAQQPALAAMTVRACALVALLWLLLAATPGASLAAGHIYHIDGAKGNDNGPGTKSEPWRTIEKANQTLTAGDTVIIHGGTYNEVIHPQRSGKPGQPITYLRATDERVLLRGRPGVTALVVIRESYIVVNGFELSYGHDLPKKQRQWGWVEISGANAHHNVIRNCRLVREGDPLAMYREDYQERGIILSATNHNLVENNYIRGLNKGIHINQAAQYNRVVNNYVTATSQSAIVVATSGGVIQGNLIERNILERSAIEDGIQFMQDFESGNKQEDVSNFGTIVRNNIIRYNAENAIDLKGAGYVVIEGNVIYGTVGSNNGNLAGWNRGSLSTINRGIGASSRDIIIRKNVLYDNASGVRVYDRYKVYNNTILFNNRDFEGGQSNWRAPGSAQFFGISEREVGTRALGIKNNIVGGHRNTGEVVLRVGGSSQLDINYNLYFNPEKVQIVDFNTSGNWSAFDLDGWRRFLATQRIVLGADNNSLVAADPKLAYGRGVPTGELTRTSFYPTADSPAVDRGGPLTLALEGGSGQQLRVQDAGYFFDGYGIVSGDWIKVGDNPPARITAINYGQNLITLDRAITWQNGAAVNLPYKGAAPDIGASELGGDPTSPDLVFSIFLPLIGGNR